MVIFQSASCYKSFSAGYALGLLQSTDVLLHRETYFTVFLSLMLASLLFQANFYRQGRGLTVRRFRRFPEDLSKLACLDFP